MRHIKLYRLPRSTVLDHRINHSIRIKPISESSVIQIISFLNKSKEAQTGNATDFLFTKLPLIYKLKTYLFVNFRSTFYFCHNHPHNSTSKSGSQREELLVRCDVMIP